jgi:hypothetical protein
LSAPARSRAGGSSIEAVGGCPVWPGPSLTVLVGDTAAALAEIIAIERS